MLSEDILFKINNGSISSRRQLYKLVGRSRALREWLDSKSLLLPNTWTKERLDNSLLGLKKDNKSLLAKDNWNLVRVSRRFYGTWNNALQDVLGIQNQKRYSCLTDEELLNTIVCFIKKNRRLPLREEFDGSSYSLPYWQTFVVRFDLEIWSDIYKLLDLTKITYFHNKKHGFGKVYIVDGVVCLSNQERLIVEYLKKQNIEFKKEVPYSEETNFTFDFYIPEFDLYVEYFGMETEDYLERIDKKRSLYGNRQVLEIFKYDNTIAKLANKVQRL